MIVISKFLLMGGYAAYVWPCYALVLIVLLSNVLWVKRAARKLKSQLVNRHHTQGHHAS